MQGRSFIALTATIGAVAFAGNAAAADVKNVRSNGFFDGPRAVVHHAQPQGFVNWAAHRAGATSSGKPAGFASWATSASSRSHGGGVLRMMPRPLIQEGKAERGAVERG